MWLWLLFLLLLSIWACYAIARSRGASVTFWVLMAILLGPLAIPFAFFARPGEDAARDGEEGSHRRRPD